MLSIDCGTSCGCFEWLDKNVWFERKKEDIFLCFGQFSRTKQVCTFLMTNNQTDGPSWFFSKNFRYFHKIFQVSRTMKVCTFLLRDKRTNGPSRIFFLVRNKTRPSTGKIFTLYQISNFPFFTNLLYLSYISV